jgi:hypothetical protein
MGKIITIRNRIYKDYFMPSKLNQYAELIREFNKLGYEFLTFRDYVEKLNENSLGEKKYFISRHDIDTDNSTAKAFFEIEKQYNIKATYYFRLSTIDIALMKEIEKYGSEASYHFEEIATYCKIHHIKSIEEVSSHLPKIETLFKENFSNIQNQLGVKLKTVCSHGDFVNRKLGIINNKLTHNQLLREELGIISETYDSKVMKSFDAYISDGTFLLDWETEDILKRCSGKNIICMLSHPREWRVSILSNTAENIKRVYEGLKW